MLLCANGNANATNNDHCRHHHADDAADNVDRSNNTFDDHRVATDNDHNELLCTRARHESTDDN